MKHLLITLLLSASTLLPGEIFARPNPGQPEMPQYTMQELQYIADSILMEGNLLALYERAAWIAGDLFQEQDGEMISRFGGYLVYHDENDDVRVLFADKAQEDDLNCIYEVIFYNDPEDPVGESTVERKFTEWEKTLWTVRNIIMGSFAENGIELTYYDNFTFNHIIFPTYNGYRLYLVSGTTLNGIFPFGNDYFFDSDYEGNIVRWRKMHSRLIAEPMEHEGNAIGELIHSHLRSEPFITPSDVCTFQLYAPYSEVKKLTVLSTALQLYFVYDWTEGTITIEEKLPFGDQQAAGKSSKKDKKSKKKN